VTRARWAGLTGARVTIRAVRGRRLPGRRRAIGVELIPHVARCDECVELLVDYISGELPPDRARALEIHLDLCPPCVSFVNTYGTP
jgi:hypothetical protein